MTLSKVIMGDGFFLFLNQDLGNTQAPTYHLTGMAAFVRDMQ